MYADLLCARRRAGGFIWKPVTALWVHVRTFNRYLLNTYYKPRKQQPQEPRA